MNPSAGIVEQLKAQGEELLRETPTLFAYGIATPEDFPALRNVHLAAYMDPALPPDSYFHVEIRLEALLEEILGLPMAGVRVLNGTPLTMQGAVLTAGEVVYSRDEGSRIAFEERVRREYLDLKAWLAIQAEAMGERRGAMIIDRERVEKSLRYVAEYLGYLQTLADVSPADPIRDGAGRYYLQVAITCCLDICQHFIAALRLRPPRELADVPEVLSEVRLLEPELVRDVVTLIQLRHQLIYQPWDSPLLQNLSGHVAILGRFTQGIRGKLQI
jgi:uncharacterized protein YutE (UPF0331/DUF86 family)